MKENEIFFHESEVGSAYTLGAATAGDLDMLRKCIETYEPNEESKFASRYLFSLPTLNSSSLKPAIALAFKILNYLALALWLQLSCPYTVALAF